MKPLEHLPLEYQPRLLGLCTKQTSLDQSQTPSNCRLLAQTSLQSLNRHHRRQQLQHTHLERLYSALLLELFEFFNKPYLELLRLHVVHIDADRGYASEVRDQLCDCVESVGFEIL